MARTGGWRRKGRKESFHYVDSHGKKIADHDKIERIEGLVIPPAWRDVWISPRLSRSRRSSTASCVSPSSCPDYGSDE